MDVPAFSGSIFLSRYEVASLPYFVYFLFRTRQKLPLISGNTQISGKLIKYLRGIMLGVNGVRKNHNIRVILELLIHLYHLTFHHRADRRTRSKEEIRDVDFILYNILSNGIPLLIYKRKIRDSMVHGIHHGFPSTSWLTASLSPNMGKRLGLFSQAAKLPTMMNAPKIFLLIIDLYMVLLFT